MPCWWCRVEVPQLICFGLRGQGLAKAGDSRCALPADFRAPVLLCNNERWAPLSARQGVVDDVEPTETTMEDGPENRMPLRPRDRDRQRAPDQSRPTPPYFVPSSLYRLAFLVQVRRVERINLVSPLPMTLADAFLASATPGTPPLPAPRQFPQLVPGASLKTSSRRRVGVWRERRRLRQLDDTTSLSHSRRAL